MNNVKSVQSILWNKTKLDRFRDTYNQTPGDGFTEFTFDGYQFLKAYAKYLIEYLDTLYP